MIAARSGDRQAQICWGRSLGCRAATRLRSQPAGPRLNDTVEPQGGRARGHRRAPAGLRGTAGVARNCTYHLQQREVLPARRSIERRDVDWQGLIAIALTAPCSVGTPTTASTTTASCTRCCCLAKAYSSPVATYQRWQAIGRQVLKGSRAKGIVRPITVTLEDHFDDEEQPRKLAKFKPVRCLFGYSETEGEERLSVEPPAGSFPSHSKRWTSARSRSKLLNGDVQGYSVGREIAISHVGDRPPWPRLQCTGPRHTEPANAAEYGTHRPSWSSGPKRRPTKSGSRAI